jgi:hypothetical protein
LPSEEAACKEPASVTLREIPAKKAGHPPVLKALSYVILRAITEEEL